jgi:L-alanine-DL-glutamate epimerase-like enolase superfamily enzyme
MPRLLTKEKSPLKITHLICEIFRWSRPNQITNGSNTYDDGVLLLLRITTNEGLTGHGWLGGTAAERPLEIFSSYIPFYRQRTLDRDPEDSRAIFSDLEHEHIKTFGFSGAHAQLTGAINCALWDIKGQIANKPVHALLSATIPPKKCAATSPADIIMATMGNPRVSLVCKMSCVIMLKPLRHTVSKSKSAIPLQA